MQRQVKQTDPRDSIRYWREYDDYRSASTALLSLRIVGDTLSIYLPTIAMPLLHQAPFVAGIVGGGIASALLLAALTTRLGKYYQQRTIPRNKAILPTSTCNLKQNVGTLL